MSLIEKIDALSITISDSETMEELISKKAVKEIISQYNTILSNREVINIIDSEIKRIEKIPTYEDCADTEEIFDEGKKSGWYGEAVRIKEILLEIQTNPLTIGDHIRESNESLAEIIETITSCCCIEDCTSCPAKAKKNGCDEKTILDYLNQPYTE
jgi:urease gamma subunit